MLDRLSSSERRGIALVFAAACLAFLAWAFPNMSRIVTIPGAITTGILAFYFLWPEIQRFVHCLPATWDENGEVKGGKIRAATAILVLLVIIGASYWELRPSVDAKGFVLSDRPTLVSMFERDLAPPLGFMVDGCTELRAPGDRDQLFRLIATGRSD